MALGGISRSRAPQIKVVYVLSDQRATFLRRRHNILSVLLITNDAPRLNLNYTSRKRGQPNAR